MKSFKEYLTESKKVYEFKVKIGGTCPKNCSQQLKGALAQFNVESVSGGKSIPIAENHMEFPEHRNIEMTVFDVTTAYPATSLQIRDKVSEALGIPLSLVKVRNPHDEKEHAINHEHDQQSGKAIIGTAPEASDNSEMYGEKYVMKFLQELSKEKHSGSEVKGYNDELFADAKKEKAQTMETTEEKTSRSPVAKKPEDVVKKVF